MKRMLAMTAVLLMTFGAAACSSDDDKETKTDTTEAEGASSSEEASSDEASSEISAEAEAYVAALEADFDPSMQASEDEIRCISEGVVDVIGVDNLQEAGVTPEQLAREGPGSVELGEDEAGAIADAFIGCLDDPMATFAASMGAGDADATACFEENLTEDQVRALLTAGFVSTQASEPSDEFMQMMSDLEAACPSVGLTPSDSAG